MLLQFEIENEGAFAERSEFSMVASHLKEDRVDYLREVGDLADTRALTSSLILGKNNSGKSTLVQALLYLSRFVRESAKDSRVDNNLPYDPNRLVADVSTNPTSYRILFSVKDIIYDFKISYDSIRVISEELDVADKSTRFRKLYARQWDESNEIYDYSFGDALTGTRVVWQQNTRENALYISTAALLNSEVLKAPYNWLANFVKSTSVSDGMSDFTASRCMEDSRFKKRVVNFLKALDINIDDIEIHPEKIDPKILSETFSQSFIEIIQKSAGKNFPEERLRVNFKKKTDSDRFEDFPIGYESTGTRALFNLAGPLFDVLENGYCLVIDEINTSLHPLIVHYLVDMFADKKVNLKRAQLIFTSHDVSALRSSWLRRDQVWFIEGDGIKSKIVPLSDYSSKRGEDREKGYLKGRYGGVPMISPLSLDFTSDDYA